MTERMVGRNLHHIGFVVSDMTAGIAGFVHSLAATWDGGIYEDPQQKVRVAFLEAGQGRIELVEPAGEKSPVCRFLREKGGGLHHVCYEVDDLENEMAAMRSRGALVAKRPKAAVAFEGRRIGWMLTPENLLIELLERTKKMEPNPCEIEAERACHG